MTIKRFPFLRFLPFLILGILLQAKIDIPYPYLLGAFIITIAAFTLALKYQAKHVYNITLYINMLLIGIAAAKIEYRETIYPEVAYDAYIVSVTKPPEQKPKTFKTQAQVLKIHHSGQWSAVNFPVLLYLPVSMPKKPTYGDVYVINGAPRGIEPPKNPFEFNYQQFQAKRNILYHDFIREGAFEQLDTQLGNPFMNWIYSLDQQFIQTIEQYIQSSQEKGIAEAMLVGIKDEIDYDTKDAYASAGAVHILAVSGLHVGILMMLIQYTFFFLSKNPRTKLLHIFISIVILWVYAFITGLSPSVTRATLMFTIFQLGTALNKKKNSLNVLGFSAFLLLLFNPSWLFEVGFQLSYLAIFGIVFLYPELYARYQPKNKIFNFFYQLSLVSICAQLFTFPLSIHYFQQFPAYFLLSNPAVSILSTLVLVFGIPLLLLAKIPWLATILAFLLKYTLLILNKTIFFFAQLPGAKWTGLQISTSECILLYVIILAIILGVMVRNSRYIMAASALTIIFSVMNMLQDFKQYQQHEITFHFIPKGFGVSFIDAKNARFICDSATFNNPRAYDFHLKNYYNDRGIKQYEIDEIDSNGYLTFDFKGQKYLWLKAFDFKRVDEKFDCVIISNNAVYHLDKKFNVLPAKIIVDGTNYPKRSAYIQEQADSLAIPFISLYERGSITY